jgi:DNA-binding NtrC family response regulator
MSAQGTTVLIIDDDPLHLKIYTWILARERYNCKTALVGSTTIELPVGEDIDIVLLDYRLSSSLTAVDVAKQVKNAFPSIPIVILSEVAWMPDDMQAHAEAFVNKGNPRLLLETVSSVLERRNSSAAK